MLKNILIIALGSGIGGVLRFVMSKVIQAYIPTAFPIGTLLVNILGCFFIGFFYGLFDRGSLISPELKLLLTVGFCGGFTTFSTFMNENLQLLRSDNILYTALYAGSSIFLGLLAVNLGNILVKQI